MILIDVLVWCLALNVYFEARGEPLTGQYAVAEVTMRRGAMSGQTECQETFLDKQFSWTLEERPVVTNNSAWLEALSVAKVVIEGQTDFSNGATHYHALRWKGRPFSKPRWAYKLCHATTIGNHVFYKPCETKMIWWAE